MPSHPDRVRRNYHDIQLHETENVQNGDTTFSVTVTRLEIATQMTTREIRDYVMRKVYNMFIVKR